jgi:hypothetical protein
MESSKKVIKPTATNSGWGKFAHACLATTCLSVAGGSAFANTTYLIVEGTPPAPSDFGNTFQTAYLLPELTNVVDGELHGNTDTADFVEFQDLLGGTGFSLLGTYNPLHQERGVTDRVFNSSDTLIGSSTLEGAGRSINGTIPTDGELFVEVVFAQGGNASYQLSLNAQTVPEPETFTGVGLALAGALAWRRKRAAKA